MRLGPNWYQIGNRTCYIQKVSKFYAEKGYLCQQAWKCHLLHVNMYFTDQNIMQEGDSTKLNFEGLEMQKWNNQRIELEEQMKKMGSFCLVIMVIS